MPKMGEGYLPLLYVGNGAGRYIKCPVLSTTQRDALTGVEGMVIFNSTTDQLEEYDGSTWQAVGQVIMDTHEADLDAHTKNPWEILRTGDQYIVPQWIQGVATLALTANQLYGLPIVVARDITIDRIAVEVTTADAGKNIRLGIYNNGTNLYPGTRKSNGGTASVGTTGIKAISVSVSLTKGLYWLACLSDGTPTVRECTFLSSPLGRYSDGFDTSLTGWYKGSVSYGNLPDPFTAGGGLTGDIPLIGIRPSSLD